jgi:hypothetical protein
MHADAITPPPRELADRRIELNTQPKVMDHFHKIHAVCSVDTTTGKPPPAGSPVRGQRTESCPTELAAASDGRVFWGTSSIVFPFPLL